jgi:hypothetical protein
MQKLLHMVIIGLLTLNAGHRGVYNYTLHESAVEQLITLPPNRDPFYLKNLCNIKPTSALISKKLDNFVYECMHVRLSHLLINGAGPNYIDVVRNFYKR